MATYTGYIHFSDGSIMQVHFASSVAVGTLLPCELNGAVSPTLSPTSFKVSRPVRIIDFTTDQTGCLVRLVSEKKDTDKLINCNAAYVVTNQARPLAAISRWTFVPGREYSLKVVTAGAA